MPLHFVAFRSHVDFHFQKHIQNLLKGHDKCRLLYFLCCHFLDDIILPKNYIAETMKNGNQGEENNFEKPLKLTLFLWKCGFTSIIKKNWSLFNSGLLKISSLHYYEWSTTRWSEYYIVLWNLNIDAVCTLVKKAITSCMLQSFSALSPESKRYTQSSNENLWLILLKKL